MSGPGEDDGQDDAAGSGARQSGAEETASPRQGAAGCMDRRLLELLVCPLTKTTLVYDEVAQELISRAAGLAYPIRNGVPLMTVEAARHIDAPRR